MFSVIIFGLIYTLICLFLILVILLQSGKGGGLSGMLGGSNPLTDTFGSSGAEKTLSKWTTICAVAFFLVALLLTILGGHVMKPRSLSDQLKSTAAPLAAPESPPPGTSPENLPVEQPPISTEETEKELIPSEEESIPNSPIPKDENAPAEEESSSE